MDRIYPAIIAFQSIIESETPIDELYSQVTMPAAVSLSGVYEEDTSADMLYAQVDTKANLTAKKSTATHTPAAEREDPEPLDQVYAQVDKKKIKKKANQTVGSSQPPEVEPPVDQLYAQVDKKKQKSKENEVCPEESGAVYSVVNKPSPPQLPPKSQELLEEDI